MSTINISRVVCLLTLLGASLAWSSRPVASEPSAYVSHCRSCHESAAVGLQDVYPSLLEIAERRTAEDMVKVVLNGKFDRAGEIAGKTIPIMPAHDYLSNEAVASVVNYARDAARVSGRVSTELVARLREIGGQDTNLALSDAEYAQADKLYQSSCAGCHAVDRSGRSGTPLHEWAMAAQGKEAVKMTIHFGTPWGMPNWGMQEELSAKEISLLARYLTGPSRGLPLFEYEDVLASWQSQTACSGGKLVEGSVAQHEDLFVALLHDVGQVMLLDGKRKEILTVLDAVVAPSEVIRSSNGRYLYVMSRSGEIVLFDLGCRPIHEVARARVGYEGRSMSLSVDESILGVGAYWPPQMVFLDALNLAPKSVFLVDEKAYVNNQTDSEISQVMGLLGERRFLAQSKAAGEYHVVDPIDGVLSEQSGHEFLRAGSTDESGRYLLTPADDGAVVVFDLSTLKVVKILDAQGLVGGSSGTSYTNSDGQAVWLSSGLGTGSVFRVVTDGDPEEWVTSLARDSEWVGSLNIASHPASENIWFDFPLSDLRAKSGTVGVLSKSGLNQQETENYFSIDAVELVGLSNEGMPRALHPQFNKRGDELWLTIWNRQDQNSAILVLDEATFKVLKVIKDPRLITPIRTFSLPYQLVR